MNMIRHHAPRGQHVSVSLKVEKGPFDNRGNGGLHQETAASIRERVGFRRQRRRLVFHDFARLFASPPISGVKQAERHEVGAAILEDVWKIPPPLRDCVRQRSGIHDPVRISRLLRSFARHGGISISSTGQSAGGTPAPQSCFSIYSLWGSRPGCTEPRTIVVRASRPHKNRKRSEQVGNRLLLRTTLASFP